MSNPADNLPGPVSDDAINELLGSLGLPEPLNICRTKVTAEYHSIYMLDLPPNDKTRHSRLVLRVSGSHLPGIKTANEVGVMTWVARHATVPVPEVVAFDATTNNPISREFTLLSRIAGDTLSDVYPSLNDAQVDGVLDQLLDILSQLHAHEWDAIGGLAVDEQGEPVVSRIVDETFWQSQDLRLWPEGETVLSLNIGGPYDRYVDYVSAQIRQYIRLISLHDKLAFVRDDIPRLEAFLDVLPRHASELNPTKLRLAHKDLHFANILYDRPSGKITAVLDWEFSGIVPFQQWDPRRAFLWTGRPGDEGVAEKNRLRERLKGRCEGRRAGARQMLEDDAAFASPLQKAMQTVTDFLRAIVEVSPRGQRGGLVPGWRQVVLENLAEFGV